MPPQSSLHAVASRLSRASRPAAPPESDQFPDQKGARALEISEGFFYFWKRPHDIYPLQRAQHTMASSKPALPAALAPTSHYAVHALTCHGPLPFSLVPKLVRWLANDTTSLRFSYVTTCEEPLALHCLASGCNSSRFISPGDVPPLLPPIPTYPLTYLQAPPPLGEGS